LKKHNASIYIFILSFFLITCASDRDQINVEELTIDDIHRAYERGDFSAEELTRAYLKRIEKYDSGLNAVTVINPDALTAARALDEEYRRTSILKPLHGIPIIVKDNINTEGMLTTAGARALSDFVPAEDAFIIRKLKTAGAIILAKSNMAEWAFSPMHTTSTTFGTTRNPYDTSRVPAGSSGGTAAAVAANFGAAGLGTDTGNSIRGPSSHCSLVGFRTTIGLISREGIVPLYLRNDVVGPMCRTVTDAVHILNAIAGPDPDDPVTTRQEKRTIDYLQYLQSDRLRGKRIGVLRALTKDINPEIDELFSNALADLDRNGAILVDPFEVPGFDSLRTDQWCAEFRKDIEQYLKEYVHIDSVATLEDIVRIGSDSEYARDGLEYFVNNAGRNGNPNIPCGDAFSDERRIAFRQAITNAMDSLNLDAVVYPTWNYPPASINRFREEYRGDNSQIIAPHTGQPAFTVPMGFTGNNLPAGIQFLGRMYSEPKLIGIAFSYEQSTGHRQRPEIKNP